MTATPDVNSTDSSALDVVRANTRLAFDLGRRAVFGRHREMILGVGWTVIQPLMLLAIYAFVFSRVFSAKWDVGVGDVTNFAIVLYSGLLLYNFFNEVVVNSTGVIANNTSLIKRTGVASAVLPMSVVAAALMTLALSSVPFIAGYAWAVGLPPPEILWLPLLLIPLVVLVAGLGFFISATVVFVRDVQPMVIIWTTLVMFLSPIFYPESAIPEQLRGLVALSPIGVPLTESKAVLFAGEAPNWAHLATYSVVAVVTLAVGYVVFRRAQSGFADVL